MNGQRWLGLLLLVAGVALLGYGTWRLVGDGGDVTPTVTPSASASQATTSDAPSASPTSAPPTQTPVPPTATPAPSLGEADVRAFVEVLVTAVQTGDVETMLANLHPATFDRYGVDACRSAVANFTNPDFEIEALEVQDPAPWDYVTDELTTTIPDAWAVPGNLTVGGGVPTQSQTFHFAPFGDAVRWFTDCGTPL